MRVCWPVIAVVFVGLGCKPPRAAAVDRGNGAPTFVEIDLSEEADALTLLDGIEIMAVSEECGDFLALEPSARLGRLVEDQIRCLNGAMDGAQRQTTKDKISRVLLADAWAKGDIHRWMGVAARHLAEVERSDPDLVYTFAFHLVEVGNPDRMDEAVHWAEVALENKSAWEGELFVRRVYGLYKVRTMAALKKWEYLEAKYRETPSDDLGEGVEEARNALKTYAREWLEYCKSAGRHTGEPLRLCAMASGSTEYCSAEG
jgi:hypothetical protein